MSYINWKAYAHRLKPFDGNLIPVFKDGKRISGAVRDHNFTVKQILALDGVRAIELRTSKQLMCLDFDSLEAIRFAETEGGFLLKDLQTWLVKRDNRNIDVSFSSLETRTNNQNWVSSFLILRSMILKYFQKVPNPQLF